MTLIMRSQIAPRAWSWGRLGHRVSARIAEQYPNPKAKEAIKALLDDGVSLADASTWADEVRGRMRKTAPWHYVDVPLDQPKYDGKFCGDDPK
jgi:nuclease S1